MSHSDWLEALSAGLAEREADDLLRRPGLPRGIDFTSNDYLGYAHDPDLSEAVASAVREHGVGAGASRLLRGHSPQIAEAEGLLAELSGREAALLFSSGFQLNAGLIPALVGAEDVVLSDALNHASLIDGVRLSRARRVVVPHADLDAMDAALAAASGARRRLVVVESLYSMEGDLAPLAALCDLAEAYDAALLVDEAHATGLYGPVGAGRVAELGLSDRVLCTVHTGGKALGVGGAWVAGSSTLVAHLVNHCRSFIYSTAPVPAVVAGLRAAVERRRADDARVAALLARAAAFRARLAAAGIDTGASESCIVPIMLGSSRRALDVASALQADGFDVRAVRPPTVPDGTARLRVTVRSPVSQATLDALAARLEELLK